MSTTAVVLSIILAVVFLLAGAFKFSGTEMAAAAPEELQVHPWRYRLAGILELLGALGLLLAAIGVIPEALGWLAAFCLSALMAIAVVTHLRVGHGPIPENQGDGWVPAAALSVLSALTGLLILL